ncbi:MAG: DUF1292 domain-containing protein [Bacilli bacterium]|nr:DUF1292 domain-containing protein [Bacilli bacterium]
MEDNKVKIHQDEKIQVEKDGQTIDCDLLFSFESDDTLKTYLGYTDNSLDTNGRTNIYVSAVDPFAGDLKLEDITDPREIDMIREVLERLDQEANS